MQTWAGSPGKAAGSSGERSFLVLGTKARVTGAQPRRQMGLTVKQQLDQAMLRG